MNLYEMSQEYVQLLELMNDPDADITVIQSVLESVTEGINLKAENIAKIIRSLDGDIDALKKEEDRLSQKRQSLSNNKDRLKYYLEEQMKTTGLTKIKTPLFSIGIQNNPPSVDLNDESLIPEEYISYEKKIDKKGIIQALKDGREIPGAALKQTQGIRIR